MGVVKFLEAKSAALTSLQKALVDSVEKVESSSKNLPELKKPAAAVKETGRTELKGGVASGNTLPPASSNQKPIDLVAASTGQTTEEIKTMLQKTAFSAGKLRDDIINKADKGKEKASLDKPARSGKPDVRKKAPAKILAVKPASVRLPIGALEVAHIQSFDPFEDERTRLEFERTRAEFDKKLLGSSSEMTPSIPVVKPKAEVVEKQAVLEERRMQELEKQLGDELAVGKRQEKIAQEQKEKEEAKRRNAEEEKEAEARQGDAAKPKPNVSGEETDRTDLQIAPPQVATVRTEERGSLPGEEGKEQKKKKRRKKRKNGERKRRNEMDVEGEEINKKKIVPLDTVEEEGGLFEGNEGGEVEERDESNMGKGGDKGEEQINADTQLLKEKKILADDKVHSAAEDQRLHLQAADRANTVFALQSESDAAVQQALEEAGLNTPQSDLPLPPELETAARNMLKAFKAREEALERKLLEWEKRARGKGESEKRLQAVLSQLVQRSSAELAERAARKKLEEEVADLRKRLHTARDDVAYYQQKFDHLLAEIQQLKSNRPISQLPSTSANPSPAHPELGETVLLSDLKLDASEIQRYAVDATEGLHLILGAINRIHNKVSVLGKRKELRK